MTEESYYTKYNAYWDELFQQTKFILFRLVRTQFHTAPAFLLVTHTTNGQVHFRRLVLS